MTICLRCFQFMQVGLVRVSTPSVLKSFSDNTSVGHVGNNYLFVSGLSATTVLHRAWEGHQRARTIMIDWGLIQKLDHLKHSLQASCQNLKCRPTSYTMWNLYHTRNAKGLSSKFPWCNQGGLSIIKLRRLLGLFSQSLRNNSSQSWCFN